MADWKDTLNLPRTGFPMKANLQTAEPKAIARWDATDLYGRIRARRKGAPKFILHDGPPYANGRIHLGTAFNKVLKDFIVRSRTMAGFDAPYVPGWDCHGLPIELKVDRELGARKRQMSIGDFRRACREYAARFVDIMRTDFKRLGVMGSWADPYLTMNYGYQSAIVKALARFVEQGMVYKGKKPVHWCIHCRTALAEAEVEYENHSSPSIFVEFPFSAEAAEALGRRVPELAGRTLSVLIWTTTPWTIPSNLAVAFHPELEYGAYAVDGTTVIVAEALAERVAQQVKRPFGAAIARFPGRTLEGLRFRHPLYTRDSVGVLADYVTLDQGTGAVHTAPGHGSDDFVTGVRYGLDIYAPVGPGGHFLDEVEMFAGQRVFDANPKIEDALAARGRLWHREVFEHAYPHCWRCHNPVIFLATSQWFVSMDDSGLRTKALDAVRHVKWVPGWGEERLTLMLQNRPDWCISRQRSWGVPIPAANCVKCGEAVLTADMAHRAAEIFAEHGADAWYEHPIEEFLPAGLACPKCGGREFERERDILDVWFDSGSSHEAVLGRTEDLPWPADLYIEGSDQYRGWFQSSLLVGLGTRGTAPYRAVVTHGFVVDEQGRKMSKSIGNTIEPHEIISKSGAEILRFWAAMVDFREEMRVGKEILARVVEAYLKIRNTLRILVANLYDFDPAVDAVPFAEMEEIDRFTLARYADVAGRVLRAYEDYDFPVVPQAVSAFVTVDLSAFCVDVAKDRLYTLAPKSRSRRSAQTALYVVADGLARLIAPILPFTSDELWQFLPGKRDDSVHLADFPAGFDALIDTELVERWQRLLRVREAVNAEIEKLRQAKAVGKSLEVKVELRASGSLLELLERHRDDLPMLFITSEVVVGTGVPPESRSGTGVPPESRSGTGVPPESLSGTGVPPESRSGMGVPPESRSGMGVPPESRSGMGVPPESRSGTGVPPESLSGTGVPPESRSGMGVPPESRSGMGVPPVETGAVYQEADDSRVTIVVSRTDGVRCDRCWRYVPAVTTDEARPGLCERCTAALDEAQA
ncbi:MAG TPA: isoleucine--tRNA ligase [Vicinamibacterales bacterium]|jgi:isoleucyl-tRNA synthetase